MTEHAHGFLVLLGEIFSNNPTEPLFHYTSLKGFRGVIDSKHLWATDTRFLNDWSEVRYIASIVNRLLDLRRQMKPERADELTVLRTALDGWTQAHSKHKGIYVCSLSENGNQLSQWRAYCPNGGGVTIGFDSVELHTSMLPRGVITVKVCYEVEQQERIVGELLDYLLYGEIPLAHMGASRTESLQEEFLLLLSMTGPVLKHPGFSEEAEWRLIYSEYSPIFRHIAGVRPGLLIDPLPALRTEYREKNQQLIPYVSLPLTGRGGDALSFDSVILGPSAEPALFAQTMRGYLRSAGVAVRSIISSGIPLRVP
jgi:Protein of unknown function (DUF2971)